MPWRGNDFLTWLQETLTQALMGTDLRDVVTAYTMTRTTTISRTSPTRAVHGTARCDASDPGRRAGVGVGT